MKLSEGVILTDRSRIVKRWKCKRAGYWYSVHDGIGVVPTTPPVELGLGSVFHDAASQLLRNWDPEDIDAPGAREIATAAGQLAAEATRAAERGIREFGAEDAAEENRRWMTGTIYALGTQILPTLPALKEIEQEHADVLPRPDGAPSGLPDVALMYKPDVVTINGRYREWKTTASNLDAKWLRQWTKNVQLMGTLKVGGLDAAEVTGIAKGYRRDGVLRHPFAWAYVQRGVAGEDRWSAGYVRGWERTATDEFEGGVIGWVEYLLATEPALVNDNFVTTPPIYPHPKLAEAYLRQVWWEEQEVRHAREWLPNAGTVDHQRLMDQHFPQNFDQCEPLFGRPCEYLNACWSGGLEGYEQRTPHHETEIAAGGVVGTAATSREV